MTWFAFHGYNAGKAVDIAGSQEKEAVVLGFHGYGSEAAAEQNPNSVNFLDSWFVNAIIADYGAAKKEGAQPGGPNASIYNPVTAVKAGATGVANSIPGVAQIGKFFGYLGEPGIWLRVGEGLIGILLILTAVSHMAGNSSLGQAARKVPLVM